jgi:putative transposase
MPGALRRSQQSGQSHFVTFSCYRRQPNFTSGDVYDLFPVCLENMRRRFALRVYGYVVMPEHVHLLLSEPEQGTLADAIHYLKLSFTKRLRSRSGICSQVNAENRGVNPSTSSGQALGHTAGSFWQKRYHDRNVRNAAEFTVKLQYLHRNPVKQGLVKQVSDWRWSSFRHYAFREWAWWKSNRNGRQETVSGWRQVALPEYFCAQVSAQLQAANLGHPARVRG